MSYLWDSAHVTAGLTGNWRPVTAEDYAIDIVSVTGTLSLLGPMAITGSPTVTPASYSYTPSINLIDGTGQVIIPITAKKWAVNVVAGNAYVQGAGPLIAGVKMDGGGYDGRGTLSSTLPVGVTGAGASVIVTYET